MNSRTLFTAVALAMLASLAACGGGDVNDDDQAQADGSVTAQNTGGIGGSGITAQDTGGIGGSGIRTQGTGNTGGIGGSGMTAQDTGGIGGSGVTSH